MPVSVSVSKAKRCAFKQRLQSFITLHFLFKYGQYCDVDGSMGYETGESISVIIKHAEQPKVSKHTYTVHTAQTY